MPVPSTPRATPSGPAPASAKIAVSCSGLSKSFGEVKAVRDISFDVARGEIFAFLGPNGAGKTTTIKMLTTILNPTAGSITLDGHDVRREPDAARQSFGIVFQDPSLDDELTAWENMELHATLYHIPAGERAGRIKEMLEFVELWDRQKDLVKHFSGGMKRRLEIARGLLHHPSILFLDEPTTGLDPQTRNHIWSYIRKLNEEKGTTIFFTTHYMDEADRSARRIAIMDNGQIVAEGTPESLKKKTGKDNLEDAFIDLTGHDLRPDEATSVDQMRQNRRMWRR